MSISFVAVAKSTGSVDPVLLKTCPKPTGTAERDLMVALVWAYEETVSSAPTGWTEREHNQTSNVVGQPERFHSYLYHKEAGASEPSSYTWETTTSTGAAPNRRVVIVSYRGCFISPPDNGISEDRAPHTENDGSNTLAIVSMNTGITGRRHVVLAAVGITTPTGSMPSPWVERLDSEGNFVFDDIIDVDGSTLANTLTFSHVITSWGFQAMLIAEPDPAGDRNYCASIDTQIN